MAPMKAMKSGAKPMTKGGLAEALASETELKRSECMKVIKSLGGVAATQLKKAGKLTISGLCMVKTRERAAEVGVHEGDQALGGRGRDTAD